MHASQAIPPSHSSPSASALVVRWILSGCARHWSLQTGITWVGTKHWINSIERSPRGRSSDPIPIVVCGRSTTSGTTVQKASCWPAPSSAALVITARSALMNSIGGMGDGRG